MFELSCDLFNNLKTSWRFWVKKMFLKISCVVCKEQFEDQFELATHFIESHTTEDQFKCIFCAVVYPDGDALEDHLKLVHTDQLYPDDDNIDSQPCETYLIEIETSQLKSPYPLQTSPIQPTENETVQPREDKPNLNNLNQNFEIETSQPKVKQTIQTMLNQPSTSDAGELRRTYQLQTSPNQATEIETSQPIQNTPIQINSNQAIDFKQLLRESPSHIHIKISQNTGQSDTYKDITDSNLKIPDSQSEICSSDFGQCKKSSEKCLQIPAELLPNLGSTKGNNVIDAVKKNIDSNFENHASEMSLSNKIQVFPTKSDDSFKHDFAIFFGLANKSNQMTNVNNNILAKNSSWFSSSREEDEKVFKKNTTKFAKINSVGGNVGQSWLTSSDKSSDRANLDSKTSSPEGNDCPIKSILCVFCGQEVSQSHPPVYHMEAENVGKSTVYFCNICSKDFAKKKKCIKHIINVHGKRKAKCNICDEKVLKVGSYSHHVKEKKNATDSTQRYLCDLCLNEYKNKSDCAKHVKRYHGNGTVEKVMIECVFCSKLVNNDRPYSHHIQIKDTIDLPNFCCDICQKSFGRKDKCTTHILNSHVKKYRENVTFNDSTQRYFCDVCQEEFKRQSNCTIHVKKYHENGTVETNLIECIFCHKMVNKASPYLHHIKFKVTLDLHNFYCDICQKSFNRKQNCKLHIVRLHARKYHVNTLECILCKKMVKGTKPYFHHIKIKDTVELRKIYCDICQKSFRHKLNCKNHILKCHVRKVNF